MKKLGFLCCSFVFVVFAVHTYATTYDLVATPTPGDASWVSGFTIRFNDLNNDRKLHINEIVSFSGLTFYPNFTPDLEYFLNQVTSVPVVIGGDPLVELSVDSYGGSSCFVSGAIEPWTFVNCDGSAQVYPPWSFSQYVWDYILDEVNPVTVLSGTEYQMTMSPAYESTPALGNDGVSDLVVYSMQIHFTDYTAPSDIWYQRIGDDGPFGPAVQVIGDLTDDRLNDIGGDHIVFTAFDAVASEAGKIMLYRLSEPDYALKMSTIAQADVIGEARIHGNNVVWVEGSSTISRIMYYDLSWLGNETKTPLIVAGPIPPASQVEISSRYIVWVELIPGYFGRPAQCDVQAFDLNSYLRVSATASVDYDDIEPSTWGDWIVWESRAHGSDVSTIEAFNLTTWEKITVADNGAGNHRPRIHGDVIVWESNLYGNLDIFLFRLSDKQTFRITDLPSGQYLSDVFGNKVAYVDTRNGNEDVYVTVFDWPLANAGDNQTVHVGSLVTLDGSGSTDPDENYPLSYSWTLKQVPEGSTANLLDADKVTSSFTADLMGDYVVELVVTDASGWKSQPDAVTISTMNTAPVASAGPDQGIILIGSTVQLDGSASYDPDGDAITYLWSFVSRPDGSAAILSDEVSPAPTFVADMNGWYEISLTVMDPFDSMATDMVTVSFDNIRPLANAGANQTVVAPSEVWLDGSASSDANGDFLTFQWSMVSKPDFSSADLSDDTTAYPHFVADLAGQYVISLTVSDGLLDSEPGNISITASASSEIVISQLQDTVDVINTIDPADFKNPAMTNALTNKIAAMIRQIENDNYAQALNKLINDILPKTNGCVSTGAPDKNDWITDCAAQAEVYPYLIEVKRLLELMLQ